MSNQPEVCPLQPRIESALLPSTNEVPSRNWTSVVIKRNTMEMKMKEENLKGPIAVMSI